MKRITRFCIRKLHGFRTIDIPIVDNTLILVGENGSGKTTIMRLLYSSSPANGLPWLPTTSNPSTWTLTPSPMTSRALTSRALTSPSTPGSENAAPSYTASHHMSVAVFSTFRINQTQCTP